MDAADTPAWIRGAICTPKIVNLINLHLPKVGISRFGE
jgi:hypothetical protein